MFISQRRGTTTDQLANVIQVLQLGRKTGILTVERGEGTTLEQGEITFVHGHMLQAYSGYYHGQEALNWLGTWEECRFSFVHTAKERTTRPLTVLPQTPSTPPAWDSLPTQELPAQMAPETTGRPAELLPDPSNPRRIWQGEDSLRLLDQAGLSRLHRHLFLLVDGRRTLPELARLMRRRQDEIQRLLHDLELLAVIQQH